MEPARARPGQRRHRARSGERQIRRECAGLRIISDNVRIVEDQARIAIVAGSVARPIVAAETDEAIVDDDPFVMASGLQLNIFDWVDAVRLQSFKHGTRIADVAQNNAHIDAGLDAPA